MARSQALLEVHAQLYTAFERREQHCAVKSMGNMAFAGLLRLWFTSIHI